MRDIFCGIRERIRTEARTLSQEFFLNSSGEVSGGRDRDRY